MVAVYTLVVESTDAAFLDFSCRKLDQMAGRIATCLDSLTDDQIWTRANPHSNAVGNLVLHLSGNVRQWLIAGVGGLPDTRERAAEFAARQLPRAELAGLLRGTVQEAISTLQALSPVQLADVVEIQGFRLTVLEAIYHVVEHFSGHTFQIILLAKAHTGRPFDFYSYLDSPHEAATP
jgi:hypothetical protein